MLSHRWLVLSVLAWASVALHAGHPSRAVAQGSARAAGSPRIRYLANEGVLLEGAGGRVFIDAFFGDGLPDYQVVPTSLRDSLERGVGGFAGPAVVLTTHGHRDHFDPAALARYLRSNGRAIAVGPAETEARLDSLSGTPRERTRAVGPTATAPADLDLGWVRLQALAIPHGHTYRPVQHVAWLITLDGTTVLHLGDTNGDPSTWPAAGLPAEGADVAFVPFWYALEEKRLEAVLAATRAHRVILIHLALDPTGTGYANERGGWGAFARDLRKRFPAVEVAIRPGEELGGHRSP